MDNFTGDVAPVAVTMPCAGAVEAFMAEDEQAKLSLQREEMEQVAEALQGIRGMT